MSCGCQDYTNPCNCSDPVFESTECLEAAFDIKCSSYRGDDIECLNILKGDTGDVVINKMATAICELQDDISPSEDKLVKVSSGDTTADYLFSKLTEGTYINLVKQNSSGNEKVNIDINTTALTPFINNLVTQNAPAESNFVANNGDGIFATAGGTHGHSPIYKIKLDPATNTALSLSSTGLKLTLAGETPLTANDSSTIDFTSSGALNHTLTASVKISATSGNSLVDSTGLFVPTLTSSNGINKNGNNFELGDPLTKDTTISGAHSLSLSQGKLLIGNTSSLFDAKLYSETIVNTVNNGVFLKYVSDMATPTNNLLAITTISGSGTADTDQTISSLVGILQFAQNGNITLGANNYSAITSNINIYEGGNITGNMLIGLSTNFQAAGTSNVQSYAALKIASPLQAKDLPNYTGTITNYYGLYIKDLSTDLGSHITNKYGIYQIGGGDVNFFGGKLFSGTIYSAPTARIDVSTSTGYSQLRLRTSYTPTSTSDSNGNVGDYTWDANYLYWKTSAGWKRASGSSF